MLFVTVGGSLPLGWSATCAVLTSIYCRLTFRHRASCILGQAFRCSPENAFYIFNHQTYFII